MKDLEALSTAELKGKWQRLFRNSPPQNARREYLLKHLHWQQQVDLHGGLSRGAKSKLTRLMKQLRDGKDLTPEHNLIIKSGTKLLREYKGVKHEVIAEGDNFKYQGEIYGSLSKIAREITGTQWNGKLFFGVNK